MRPVSTPRQVAGFTLIELIVVIMILAILAAVALPRFTDLQKDARVAKLNAARGSVAASAAMVHATVLARNGVTDAAACTGGGTANNLSAAAGTLCTESGIINLVWGYPAVTALGTAGLLSAAGLTTVFNPATAAAVNAEGYTYANAGAAPATATFGVTGAPTPATCVFTYAEPTAANTAPVISAVNTAGC